MRDPKRLYKFYQELMKIHMNYFPDWRFGQLVDNFYGYLGNDAFYLEEDRFIERLKEYVVYVLGRDIDE